MAIIEAQVVVNEVLEVRVGSVDGADLIIIIDEVSIQVSNGGQVKTPWQGGLTQVLQGSPGSGNRAEGQLGCGGTW